MTKTTLAILSGLFLNACSFVEPIPGSKQIILSDNPKNCEKIAELEVKVLDTVVGMERRNEAIREELLILAQNAAVRKKGNAIWPVSEVENGSQQFHILRCGPDAS